MIDVVSKGEGGDGREQSKGGENENAITTGTMAIVGWILSYSALNLSLLHLCFKLRLNGHFIFNSTIHFLSRKVGRTGMFEALERVKVGVFSNRKTF